jgi:organic radical activating enzyme
MNKDYKKFIDENGDYFCVLPFTEICNTAQGQGKLCCYSDNVDNENFNYDKNFIDTWKNNSKLNDVRQRMLDNKPIRECRRCYQYEKAGAHSMSKRLKHSIGLERKFPGSIKEMKENKKLTLRSLDIKFGNKCNLACIMCDGGSSSLHVKEKENNPVPKDLHQWIPASGKDNTFDKNNLEELLAQAPNLMRLKFTGGEPTLLDGFKEFIERLSETEYAKNIDVMIVTNGTTDVTKWIDTFSKFKLFEINWSTDGVGSAFEYIRWPGKWEKTQQMQTKFNQTIKEKGYTNIVSILTSAIQLLNLDQLPKLLHYCEDANFDWFSPVLVMWPEPLQLGIAPEHIKQQVIKDCLPYTQKGKKFSEVDSFIKLIEGSSSHLTWDDTKKFLSYYDNVRNISAKDTCPIYNEIENTLQGVSPL